MSRLYVGNLSYSTTEDSLRNVFAQDGRVVENVSIITDRETGQPRGFAFVEMGSPADAQAAISALDGSELDGRRLRVNQAHDKRSRFSPPRNNGGGQRKPSRRGGGGRRRGGDDW